MLFCPLSLHGDTWLGLNDIQTEGALLWDDDGSPVTWAKWGNSNSDGDDCAMLKDTFEYEMRSCTDIRYFSCQTGTGEKDSKNKRF